jgi:hypothetical protein
MDGNRGQYFSALFSIQVRSLLEWIPKMITRRPCTQRAVAQTDFLIPPIDTSQSQKQFMM